MKDEELFKEITREKLQIYKNTEHETVNFFDDSMNIIDNNNKTELKKYVEQFKPHYLKFSILAINWRRIAESQSSL